MVSESDIEEVARAFAAALGDDPDAMVTATGYRDSQRIPRWWKEREWALRCLVAMEVMGIPK